MIVGLFVTIPITMMATVFVYRKLLAQIETVQVAELSTGGEINVDQRLSNSRQRKDQRLFQLLLVFFLVTNIHMS